MKELNMYTMIALGALIVGGINVGFMGLFNVNIIGAFGLLGRLLELGIGVGAGYLGYLAYLEKFKKA